MDWNESLKQHIAFAREQLEDKYIILAVCCKGSQNYKLADENSDFDSICLVVPKLSQLAREQQPISTTLVLENGEQMKVKDIRVLVREVIKSWTYWEIFVTDLAYWNPQYICYLSQFESMIEAIAHMASGCVVKSILGEARREYNNTKSPNAAKRNKAAMKVLRFEDMMDAYIQGAKVTDILVQSEAERELLLKVKRGEVDWVHLVEDAMVDMEDTVDVFGKDTSSNYNTMGKLYDLVELILAHCYEGDNL